MDRVDLEPADRENSPLTHKLFCYVDETGQDTQGRLFVVAVVITESEREALRQQCSAIELESGKGQRKWVKSKHDRRLAYMRQVLKIPALHGKLCFSASHGHADYLDATVRAIAGSLRLVESAEFQATILIDGLPRSEERQVGLQLRRLGVPVKKVRGAQDETDVLIRLADAVCGFVRSALEGQPDMRSLLDEQLRLGVLREVSGK